MLVWKAWERWSCPSLLYRWTHMWYLNSVQFSRSVVSNSLQPHGLQHARHPCLENSSPPPGAHLFLCCPLLPSSIFPSIRVFSNESVLRSVGLNIGVSASASVLPVNSQDWFPLGWISLLSKGLWRVFSNTTVQKHQFFGAQLSL